MDVSISKKGFAMKKQRVIVSVTSDLETDKRVARTCEALHEENYDVIVIGRRKRSSSALKKQNYKCRRMRMLFEKEIWFYAEFNLRLFFYLLFHRADILYANDLDTLLPNFLISKIKRIPIIYDSHEYFTEVPELAENTFAKRFWLRIEEWIFPKLKNVITVCDSIARIYVQKYRVQVHVIRNLPLMSDCEKHPNIHFLENETRKILLYQGAVNKDRGLEEAISAMQFLENAYLIIIGIGDEYKNLQEKVVRENLSDRVLFMGRIPYDELSSYTCRADIGLSLEKPTNLNYRYCLPNKLFDYIHGGVPVLVSDLPEMRNIVELYHVGKLLPEITPEAIATYIQDLLSHPDALETYKKNEMLAAPILSWDNEKKILLELVNNCK